MTADEERRAIIREIAELAGFGHPPEGVKTFTAGDLAEHEGINVNTARRHLNTLYERGELGRCQTVTDGYKRYLYWRRSA